MSTFEKIDKALEEYYKSMGADYKADDGSGKFIYYCNDNGFEEADFDFEEEFINEPDPLDCMFCEFDEDFPLDPPLNDEARTEKIFEILVSCYTDGTASSKQNDTNEEKQNIPDFDLIFTNKKDFVVSKKELEEIKKLYESQIPTLYKAGFETDGNLLKVLALGRKNTLPLLQHFADMYARERVKAKVKNGGKLEILQWASHNSYLQKLKGKDKNAAVLFQAAVTSFFKRVCGQIVFTPMVTIKDKLQDIALYIAQASSFINKQLRDNQQSTPFQCDFCIAFGEVSSSLVHTGSDHDSDSDDGNGDDSDEDDAFQLDDGAFYDCFGDILGKLETNKAVNVAKEIMNSEDVDEKHDNSDENTVKQARAIHDTFNLFRHKMEKEQNVKSYPHKKRFCAVIDRRKKNDSKNDNIIFFEPPSNCNTIPNDHVPEWYLNASKECIIPSASYKPQTGDPDLKGLSNDEKAEQQTIRTDNTCQGAVLILSFHVQAADTTKCYLYLNGQISRFFPEDIINILPTFFDMTYKNNQAFIKGDQVREIIDNMHIVDRQFEIFVQKHGKQDHLH